jgi:hypothetical protein
MRSFPQAVPHKLAFTNLMYVHTTLEPFSARLLLLAVGDCCMKSCCLQYGKGSWPFAGNGFIVLTTILLSILTQACM